MQSLESAAKETKRLLIDERSPAQLHFTDMEVLRLAKDIENESSQDRGKKIKKSRKPKTLAMISTMSPEKGETSGRVTRNKKTRDETPVVKMSQSESITALPETSSMPSRPARQGQNTFLVFKHVPFKYKKHAAAARKAILDESFQDKYAE